MLLPLILFLLNLAVGAGAATFPGDIAALSAFKSAISLSSISPWSCLASWNFSSDPCSPSDPSHFVCGLSCLPGPLSRRVSALSLDAASYSGVLSPGLSALSALSHLSLSSNSFHGPIPASLSTLPSLSVLDLSSNSFSGVIPPEFASFSALAVLDLSRNALTGGIPASFSALSSLTTLDLSFNRLSGELPSQLPPNLIEIAVKGNSLAGGLKKSTFSPLSRLEVAELSANKFAGKLEGWFLLLPSLQQVDLSNNSLNQLEVWPAAGSGGKGLVAVDLSYNRIEGQLSAELAGYPSLAALSARHNRLRGNIPAEFARGKKGVPFRRLFLDGNFLNGKVPAGFVGGSGAVAGSFGDNCLEGCPAAMAVCAPEQKPGWVCRQAYRGRSRKGVGSLGA